MKTIRTSVFECNSSSSHSLTIGTSRVTPEINYNGEPYVIEGGDYGWGFDKLTTPGEKISYVAVEAELTNNETLKEWLVDVIQSAFNCGEVVFNFSTYSSKDQTLPEAYIDHQSVGLVADSVSSRGDLEDLIFTNSTIYITNDNG